MKQHINKYVEKGLVGLNHIKSLDQAKKLTTKQNPLVIGYWVTKEQYLFGVVKYAYGKHIHYIHPKALDDYNLTDEAKANK